MPRKKKSSLGRKTRNAKSLAALKSNESPADSQDRLDSDRIRKATQRAKESSEERSQRQAADNERHKKTLRSLKATKNALVTLFILINYANDYNCVVKISVNPKRSIEKYPKITINSNSCKSRGFNFWCCQSIKTINECYEKTPSITFNHFVTF